MVEKVFLPINHMYLLYVQRNCLFSVNLQFLAIKWASAQHFLQVKTQTSFHWAHMQSWGNVVPQLKLHVFFIPKLRHVSSSFSNKWA